MAANSSGLLVIERILRDRQGVWRQIVAEHDLGRFIGQMLASSAIALACYGAVLGSFNGPLMALTSAVKLPMLFLVTLTICLPALYLFNLVFGARLSVRQALALVMVAITVTSMLSLAFAPISLFFRITAPHYEFFKILNVAILTLTAFVGLRFLTNGMYFLNVANAFVGQPASVAAPTPAAAPALGGAAHVPAPATSSIQQPAAVAAGSTDGHGPAVTAPVGGSTAVAGAAGVGGAAHIAPRPAQAGALPTYSGTPGSRPASTDPAEKPASMTLLYIWILLFGFVGTQLAWTLRPFFGNPDQPFELFRNIEGNFYTAIFKAIANLF